MLNKGEITRLNALNLAARRGEDLLFRGVSFTLSGGEALVLTGRNGSGKSTLLRVVAGFIRPDHGTVAYESPGAEPRPVREVSHYLGHRNGMKAELTVTENLSFWKDFLGDADQGTSLDIEDAAERVGLASITHLPYGYLSAGQQRRFAMARLLVAHRPVWLLDEPTAALDIKADAMFSGLVRDHLTGGGMVIAATHQPLGLNNPQMLEMKGFDYRDMEDAA